MVTTFGLAIFAVVGAAVAIWEIDRLKSHLHIKDQISTRKWQRAAKGSRFQVLARNDIYPVGTNLSQAAFFGATSIIPARLNEIYSDGSWSFEDESKLHLEEIGGASRSIVIRHGQQKTGLISINTINFGSDIVGMKGKVYAKLEIINARFWPFYDVYGIAISVAQMICDVEKYDEAQRHAAVAALECMWMIGKESFGNPVFEFTVSGRGLLRSVDP